jgi:hypothetical protein
LGIEDKPSSTFINENLSQNYKKDLLSLLQLIKTMFPDIMMKISSLDRSLVEHSFPIKIVFKSYKHHWQRMAPNMVDHVEDEMKWLLKARFTRPIRYDERIPNIVLVLKKQW